MRGLLIGALILCLAGCGPSPSNRKAAAKAASDAKLTAAKKEYAVFLEEATKGVELLESHPDGDAIRAESGKLHDLLERAADVYPNSEKMGDLVDEGRTMLRYFDAALKVANYQAKRKDVAPEKAREYIAKTCDGNAPAMRKMIAQLQGKLEP